MDFQAVQHAFFNDAPYLERNIRKVKLHQSCGTGIKTFLIITPSMNNFPPKEWNTDSLDPKLN